MAAKLAPKMVFRVGEYFEVIRSAHGRGRALKLNCRPTDFADPVFLHQLYLVRPLIEGLFSPSSRSSSANWVIFEGTTGSACASTARWPPALPSITCSLARTAEVDRIPVADRALSCDRRALSEIEEQRLSCP